MERERLEDSVGTFGMVEQDVMRGEVSEVSDSRKIAAMIRSGVSE